MTQESTTAAGSATTPGTIKTLDLLQMAFETDDCHSGPMSDSEDNNLIIHQRKGEPERDRVVDFVVMPVQDMACARSFYEGTLGLTLTTEGRGIWAEYVLPDVQARRQDPQRRIGRIPYWPSGPGERLGGQFVGVATAQVRGKRVQPPVHNLVLRHRGFDRLPVLLAQDRQFLWGEA